MKNMDVPQPGSYFFAATKAARQSLSRYFKL